MTYKQLKKKEEGFTIIEVLIVLAIAGLIMLIVFLAVPALTRSQRNNARANDASRVAAAVTECLANRNGVVASCSDVGANGITAPQLSRLENITFATTYNLTDAAITFGNQCDNAGAVSSPGGGTRAFTITYQLEPGTNRCISS